MSVTRAELAQRRAAIKLGVIPYSQAKISPVTNRRSDCSGLASYHFNIPIDAPGTYLHALNTASLVTTGAIFPVAWADLRPGDAIGCCGPTSPGNGGHIAMWLGAEGTPAPGGRHHVWDHGSGMGPKDRWVQWDGKSTGWMHPDKIGAWRFSGVVEDDGTSYSASPFVEGDMETAKFLQQALHDAGYDIGTSGPNHDGVDGDLGAKSLKAMTDALRAAPATPSAELTKAAILAALGE